MLFISGMYEVERSGETERITIRASGGVGGTSEAIPVVVGFTSRLISERVI